ncbi:MAG: hypothetical protein QOJ28_765 [Mycobacterium sp.]|nr:hypothetical protein [Mycobacterium sp.]
MPFVHPHVAPMPDAHGGKGVCGRTRFTAADLAERTRGIEYRHGVEWIDEIPDAYKDVDQVMADAADLVEVEHVLRQVLNVKGQ